MLIRIRMDKGESTIDSSHALLLDRLKEEGIKTVGISFGSPYLPSYESLMLTCARMDMEVYQ